MVDFNLLICYLLNMEELHKQFVKLGRERHKITYKLLALLPKIYESEVYKKYYPTIYEYAGKLAGLSHGVVEKALSLDQKLEDKPCLQRAIETQGIHKVAIVANLATPETDEVFADKVENMSKGALQELSKELRGKRQKITIELDEEMESMFLKLKEQLGVSDDKDALKQILEFVTKIPGEKRDNLKKPCSRCIPAHKKRQAGDKCTYPGCNKPAEVFHHRDRFSNKKSHDSVVALCKQHHEFAHNGVLEDETTWKLKLQNTPTEQSDLLYRKYRQASLL